MSIEAKNIKFYVWRFLEFSVKSASLCAQRYPLATGVLFFSFVLYILFPFIFKLLVYSVPLLAGIGFGVSRYLFPSSATRKVGNLKGDGKADREFSHSESDSAQDSTSTRRLKKPLISAQMSKRRFKTRREELDAIEVNPAEFSLPLDSSSLGKIEKFADSDDPIIGEPERCQGDSSRKAETSDERDLALGGSEPQQASTGTGDESCNELGNGGPSTAQSVMDSEEAEDDDEEDERNRAVEWTEDDQKNVMDLGFSELERNRRLENLIAKRRARKLMTALRGLTELDTTAMSSHIPSIQITKNNPFIPSGPEEDLMDSQIPGSAPSVLLPARNPFDIPYDPLEEKPNLTTDGFHQEFLASSQPRDIYCRHESFTLGPSFSAEMYEDEGLMGPRESRLSRFRRGADKGDHDRLVEQILYHGYKTTDHHAEQESKPQEEMPKEVDVGHEENTENGDSLPEEHLKDESVNSKDTEKNTSPENEVVAEPEEGDLKSDTSSTSEKHQEELMPKESGEGQDTIEMEKVDQFPKEHSIPRSGGSSTTNGPSYGSSQSLTGYLDRGMGHSTTYSIASDMQVEVSETGSPRNISDYVMSPPDVIEEDELGMNEFNEADQNQQEDAAELGISEANNHSVGVDPSLLAVAIREMDEEDSAGKISTSSSSTTINPEEGHLEHQVGSNNSVYINEGNSEDQTGSNDMYSNEEPGERKPGSPDSLEAEIPEEAIQFIDNSESHEAHSHEPEEISSSTGSSNEKLENSPNEIVENSSVADDNNDGPTQHTVDEIRNQTEQDIIPQNGSLEEEDINPFASPIEQGNTTCTTIEDDNVTYTAMEDANMTCTTINSTAEKDEDRDTSKPKSADGLDGELPTQPGEEMNLSSTTPNS